MGLETREILAAAGTKWNFHGYVPGLVGGHCIGVDPYYLTHKAQSVGFHPEMILAGRRINDGMAQWVALDIVKLMLRQKLEIGRARILVMGLTFKENCPDIRNTKVVDLVRELGSLAGEVAVYDPLADPDEVRREYDIESLVAIPEGRVRRDRACGAPRPDQRAWRRTPAGDAASGRRALRSQAGAADRGERRPAMNVATRRPSGGREIDGMKVLVTGVAGFIGSQTARALLARGDEVIGLDNLNDYYDVNLKLARLAKLQGSNSFQFVKADLADRGEIEGVFAEHRPERVVNLAAQAGVRYAFENPHSYVDSNLVGFLHILEGCRHHGVEHLVYASSSSVYGANTSMPFSIHDNVDHPLNLYAASKKANELMAHSYAHLYRLPVTGLRFFTVYGPWGRPDMSLFLFTKNIIEGKPIDVFNFGQHARDFTYIDDIVEGVVRTLDKVATPNPEWNGAKPDPGTSAAPYRLYNIGNNQPVELMYFIECIEKAVGKKAVKNMLPLQPGDVPKTFADVDALVADIGFQPKTPIEEGVRRFVDWYKEFYRVA